MDATLTRRELVKAGAGLAAGTLVVGSAGCAHGRAANEEMLTPSTRYGGGEGNGKRVLVGYATRTGSTVGVAQAIGEALGQRGFVVDVMPVQAKPSVGDYDAVVLGSAINGGAWLPEAMELVEQNQQALSNVPMAAFCVHAMNLGPSDKQRARRLAYLDPVRALVRPLDEGYFAGKGPPKEEASFFARWVFRQFGGGGEGDLRVWKAIRAWSQQVQLAKAEVSR